MLELGSEVVHWKRLFTCGVAGKKGKGGGMNSIKLIFVLSSQISD
jgi:hypothetical protein